MSEYIDNILEAIMCAEREPRHTLSLVVSYEALRRIRMEVEYERLTGKIGKIGCELAGVPVWIDPALEGDYWHLSSVEPARIWARRPR